MPDTPPQQPTMVPISPDVAGYLLDELARANAQYAHRIRDLETAAEATADDDTHADDG
jgi:hypothetical protein